MNRSIKSFCYWSSVIVGSSLMLLGLLLVGILCS